MLFCIREEMANLLMIYKTSHFFFAVELKFKEVVMHLRLKYRKFYINKWKFAIDILCVATLKLRSMLICKLVL